MVILNATIWVRKGQANQHTYLTDCLQSQPKVEPIANLCNTSSRDDMVDALVGIKSQIKQGQHRLIVGHIGGLEECPWRMFGFGRFEFLDRLSQ